jgi:hypothetical protein
MKKHLSVLMLFARSTIWKLFALLLLTAGAEVLLFCSLLPGAASPEAAAGGKGMALVFAAAFVLLSAMLCLTGCDFGGKLGDTLGRLRISERAVYFWQSAYNLCCYFILWGFQTALSFGLCEWYMAKADPAAVSGQSVFLAFYADGFLHSLLPLDEASRWVRNGCMLLSLGFSSAAAPLMQRRGKLAFSMLASAATALFVFTNPLGNPEKDFLVAGVCTAWLAWALAGALRKQPEEEACADEEA